MRALATSLVSTRIPRLSLRRANRAFFSSCGFFHMFTAARSAHSSNQRDRPVRVPHKFTRTFRLVRYAQVLLWLQGFRTMADSRWQPRSDDESRDMQKAGPGIFLPWNSLCFLTVSRGLHLCSSSSNSLGLIFRWRPHGLLVMALHRLFLELLHLGGPRTRSLVSSNAFGL